MLEDKQIEKCLKKTIEFVEKILQKFLESTLVHLKTALDDVNSKINELDDLVTNQESDINILKASWTQSSRFVYLRR